MYYLSLEFLLGRLLRGYLINLNLPQDYSKAADDSKKYIAIAKSGKHPPALHLIFYLTLADILSIRCLTAYPGGQFIKRPPSM